MPTTEEARVPILTVAGRCAAGWLVGYLISAVTSFLLFRISGISPEVPASAAFVWGSAVYGVIFAGLGSWVGAGFWRPQALGIGAAIAATIAAVAFWSLTATPHAAHWSQAIAILLMAPAAQFGAFFRRDPD